LFSIAALAFALAGCGASSAPATEHPTDPLDSVSAEELYQRGLAAGQAGDFVRAEQYLAAAIDRGIPEEQAMPPLIEACVQSSRLAAALGHAEPYLTQHPAQWSLRLLVASIHMALGHHEHARDELQRVLQDAPEEPPTAHYFLGVLLRDDLDDIEAAREHFRRYLALAPEGPHHEEALMALPAEERGLPVRIESSEGASVPRRVESAESAPTEGAPQETAQDAGATP
jgi:tetratricopeptide (TPR) repeat protein